MISHSDLLLLRCLLLTLQISSLGFPQLTMIVEATRGSSSSLDLQDFPYLRKLEQLQPSFPALKSALDKLRNSGDVGRKIVAGRYSSSKISKGVPGRCAVLEFSPESVHLVDIFESPDSLNHYLSANPVENHGSKNRRRLFILEDLEPKFVDRLGEHLDVDPLVFSSQMNTWYVM